MNKEIKSGVILSYLLLILNTLYGLIITPYILKYVGENAYGVYKSVASISSSLAVMDLGLGTTMTRYMAKYHATKDNKGAENFAGMIFAQYGIISLLIAAVGVVLVSLVDSVYSTSFAVEERALAKVILSILIVNMILRLLENLFFGILSGYEKFQFSNAAKVINVVLKFSLIILLLPIFKNVLLIVLLETVIVICTIIIYVFYIFKKVHLRPKIYYWDQRLFKESFGYTALMFIQTITVQFNGNIDNILIGARISAASVTVYSMALQIFGMYENLSGSIANIMLPNITKKVVNNSSSRELQSTVVRAGRFQFLLLAAALGGFCVLGKDFYQLWLGDSFSDCYLLTLILIIPVTFPMVQNVSLSILRAENKMLYRTITLAISCVLNFAVTLVGISLWGYWGAALGTASATFLNLILMNYYYHKELGFNVFSMFYQIFHRIILCAVVASIVTYIAKLVLYGSWFSFIFDVIIFMITYIVLLMKFGLSESERNIILGRFARKIA